MVFSCTTESCAVLLRDTSRASLNTGWFVTDVIILTIYQMFKQPQWLTINTGRVTSVL